jgi:hypothetical protein
MCDRCLHLMTSARIRHTSQAKKIARKARNAPTMRKIQFGSPFDAAKRENGYPFANSFATMNRLVSRTLTRRVTSAVAAKRTLAGAADLVKTSLYDLHKELGGDMVPFAGYELPVLYKGSGENGGVMKEHLWCRAEGKSSLFDVSHMGQVSRKSGSRSVSLVAVVGVASTCHVLACWYKDRTVI